MRSTGVRFTLEIGAGYRITEEALLPLLAERGLPVQNGDRVKVTINVVPAAPPSTPTKETDHG